MIHQYFLQVKMIREKFSDSSTRTMYLSDEFYTLKFNLYTKDVQKIWGFMLTSHKTDGNIYMLYKR